MKRWVSAIGATCLLATGVAGCVAPDKEIDLEKWCAETEPKVWKLGEEFKKRTAEIQPIKKEAEKELKKALENPKSDLGALAVAQKRWGVARGEVLNGISMEWRNMKLDYTDKCRYWEQREAFDTWRFEVLKIDWDDLGEVIDKPIIEKLAEDRGKEPHEIWNQ